LSGGELMVKTLFLDLRGGGGEGHAARYQRWRDSPSSAAKSEGVLTR
jgi:hypothetical protein